MFLDAASYEISKLLGFNPAQRREKYPKFAAIPTKNPAC
jgi:hypothetical protein